MVKIKTTPMQKVMIIMALGTFIALMTLTAALPIMKPSNQSAMSVEELNTDTLDNGDTAWMIVATIMGFLLTPALTALYANIYGEEEDKLFQIVLVTGTMITFLWILFSFSMGYGTDANGDQIMGFPLTYYMFNDVGPEPNLKLAPTIPLSIYAMFELSFAILTPAIISCSVIGRVNLYGLLFFLLVFHLCVYVPLAHITWHPRGWFPTHNIEDFSGAIVVHMLSSITILAFHSMLDFFQVPETPMTEPNNRGTVLISTLLVWFLWFGISAGKAHNAGPVATQAVVNTIAAVFISILTHYLTTLYFDRIFNVATIYNAIMIALIAVTPSSGFTTVGGIMFITIVTVFFTHAFSFYLTKQYFEFGEPLSLFSLHGIGGTISFLMTAVSSYRMVNDEAFNGATWGRGVPFGYHIAASLAIWSCAYLAVLLTLFLCNLVVPLSKEIDPKDLYRPPVSNYILMGRRTEFFPTDDLNRSMEEEFPPSGRSD